MVYSRERQSFHGNGSTVFIVSPRLKPAHLSIRVSMALAKLQHNVASNISLFLPQ